MLVWIRWRIWRLKCAYNLSKDENIKKQIDKLEEAIRIKIEAKR